MDVLVLAEEDILIGFKSAGINGFSPVNREEAVRYFNEVINGKYGSISLLIVSEQVVSLLGDVLTEHQLNGDYPLISEIPGLKTTGGKRTSLLEAIKKAVGIAV